MSIHIDIIGWIKGWRLDKFVKSILKDENNEKLQEYATKGVILVQSLREKLESPTMEDINEAIPGTWDDESVEKVKEVLPKVLDAMTQGSECLAKETLVEKALCVYTKIKGHPDESVRANGWNGLATSFAFAMADGKFDISDVLMVVPSVWKAIFGKKKAS